MEMVVGGEREENGESETSAKNIYVRARVEYITSCAAGSSIDAIQYTEGPRTEKRGEF